MPLADANTNRVRSIDPDSGLVALNTLTSFGERSALIPARPTLPVRALIGGQSIPFASAERKFRALAAAWDEHNSGRSIVDYYHISHMQIIAMREDAVPHLLARLRQRDGRWIFALKCITGTQAETPEMQRDPNRVIDAWLEWGERYERERAVR